MEKTTIVDLENQLTQLENEQNSLKSSIKELEDQESRFYNMFKNSSVAIWEEDFSEAYMALEKLPCNTRTEYTEYLDEHPVILKELIGKIKIMDINEATVTLFNAENKDHLLSSMDKIFISESFNTLRDQFTIIATGGYHYECETIGHRFGGSEFHVLLTAFFPNKHDKLGFITMMDITDRFEKEQQHAKLLKETIEQKKIVDILMDITFSLSSKTNQNDILDTILEQIEELVPYSSANIMLHQGNNLVVVRHRGYDKFGAAEFMDKFSEKIVFMGAAKTFVDSSQMQIIEDTNTYPGWKKFPQTPYIQSILSIPIEWQGKVIGLLNLDSNKKSTFSQKDAEKLKILGHAAAITLQKAELFKQIEKDIEKRKKTKETLKFALEEKEILLQEIHHRVKNNLTIIISLISLQNAKSSNAFEVELFEELSQRIHSIALVHEKLYENHNLSNIDFYEYTYDLINSIRDVLAYRSDIRILIDIPQNIYFDLDKLIPLGLSLNELITNSLKYAFPKSGGEISVSLDKTDHYFTLSVNDNGIGYPDDVLAKENTHLGLILVNSLVEQIKGSISLNNSGGASATIRFSDSEN